jgi:chromosome segregation ATPase
MSAQPELVCSRCQQVEARVAELEQALRSMSDENTELAAELAGARSTQITLERQLRAAKAETAKARETSPEFKRVKAVHEHWQVASGHTGCSLTEDRIKTIRGALRHYKFEAVIEAVDGACLKPYVRYGTRYVYGQPKTERKTQIEHCIGKAKNVEENRKIWQAAQETAASRLELLLDIHSHFQSLEQAYMQLILNAACAAERERAGEDVTDLVAHIDRAEAEIGVLKEAA